MPQLQSLDILEYSQQEFPFDLPVSKTVFEPDVKKILENYLYKPQQRKDRVQLNNRRYIGGKFKLIEWIFSILNEECKGKIFADIFAGTGVVAAVAARHFEK